MWNPVSESSNTGPERELQEQEHSRDSQARLSKRTESPWRKCWGGMEWRLADNFVCLKNNIDRFLPDLTERVGKFKSDNRKLSMVGR